jgi:FkbM family methyltransferase
MNTVQAANDGTTIMQRMKQSKLYPLYFLLRSPLLVPRLVANEGLGGALRWLAVRMYLLFARLVDGRKDFYEQPVREFRSRLGFSLVRRVEYLVYDEIFLDYCYAFNGFPELVKQQKPLRVLDFGTHHGLFIDYLRMLNPKAEVYGAEMNPESFAVARQRFSHEPRVHINHVAIGGNSRRLKVGTCNVSVEQSIYLEQNEGGFEVDLVTPMEFIQRQGLQAQDISLVKMDIEGAEREVFANLDSFKPILQATQAFVIEIHPGVDASSIQKICASAGLSLVEQRGINYFFRR